MILTTKINWLPVLIDEVSSVKNKMFDYESDIYIHANKDTIVDVIKDIHNFFGKTLIDNVSNNGKIHFKLDNLVLHFFFNRFIPEGEIKIIKKKYSVTFLSEENKSKIFTKINKKNGKEIIHDLFAFLFAKDIDFDYKETSYCVKFFIEDFSKFYFERFGFTDKTIDDVIKFMKIRMKNKIDVIYKSFLQLDEYNKLIQENFKIPKNRVISWTHN